MTETLKLCPFCGGKAHYYYERGNDSIVCEECGAKLTYFDFGDAHDELVKAWNTRQTEDAKVNHEPTSYSCRACKNATDIELKRLRGALEEIKQTVENAQDTAYPLHIALDSKDGLYILEVIKEALKGEKE